jgi:hypothetical protein
MQLAPRFGLTAAVAASLLLVAVASGARAQPLSAPPQAQAKVGMLINDPRAFRGYTLMNPLNTTTTYLIDMEGRVVKAWQSEHSSMHAAYLLEDGHLLRVGILAGGERAFGTGPGSAGRIQEFTWDGDLVWDFVFHNKRQFSHHDAARMPNGHVLVIVWEKKTRDEAIAAGRKPELVSNYLLPDSIVEVKPTGRTTGEVVWEWHLWDHLVQDHDPSKANFGDVAAHPERVDVNFVESPLEPGTGGPGPRPDGKAAGRPDDATRDAIRKAEAEKLKTLGYIGSPRQRSQRINPDWCHSNAVDYDAALDQIMITVPSFNEIWIIDHSTTRAQAAGHAGGRSGKGGDLLYRWGNPRTYRAGTRADQSLFAPHSAHWIPRGLPGEGHLLVFNNGVNRPEGNYSSVDELVLPIDASGRYARDPGTAFGPKRPVWSYTAPKKSDFYAFFISGAHRLPNGDTTICSGPDGLVFEVTPAKEVVWKYVCPVKGVFNLFGFGLAGFGAGGPPRPNQVVSSFARDRLRLSAEQKKEIDALQKTVDTTLGEVLTDAQERTLRERSVPGPGGFAAMPAPGQFMSVSTQVALKPTREQRARLSDLQKAVDAELDRILTADQKKRLKELRADFARGVLPGGPGGGPSLFQFEAPPGESGLYRAYRYGPDYPGLAGKVLEPGKTIEELQSGEKAKGSGKAKETVSR